MVWASMLFLQSPAFAPAVVPLLAAARPLPPPLPRPAPRGDLSPGAAWAFFPALALVVAGSARVAHGSPAPWSPARQRYAAHWTLAANESVNAAVDTMNDVSAVVKPCQN